VIFNESSSPKYNKGDAKYAPVAPSFSLYIISPYLACLTALSLQINPNLKIEEIFNSDSSGKTP